MATSAVAVSAAARGTMVEEEREGRGAEAARTELEVFFLVGGEEVEKKDEEKKIKPGERGEKVRLNRPLFQIHRGALRCPFSIGCDSVRRKPCADMELRVVKAKT